MVVRVLADGSLRINQEPVSWDKLSGRLVRIYAFRADHVAFIQGDDAVEFESVARVIDVMHSSGIFTVGLLGQNLQAGH